MILYVVFVVIVVVAVVVVVVVAVAVVFCLFKIYFGTLGTTNKGQCHLLVHIVRNNTKEQCKRLVTLLTVDQSRADKT